MSILIRKAGVEDAAIVVHLIRELAATGGEESPIREQTVKDYLATPGNEILLAQQGKHVVGLLSYSVRPNLYHAADSALIEEFVVSEGMRNMGLGSALLKNLLERLEQRGCAEVSVTTMLDNHTAIHFYKAHGLTDEALFLEKHF